MRLTMTARCMKILCSTRQVRKQVLLAAWRRWMRRHTAYLSVFFMYKADKSTAVVVSARDMSDKERKAYGRK